jgi:hypothetical protein
VSGRNQPTNPNRFHRNPKRQRGHRESASIQGLALANPW